MGEGVPFSEVRDRLMKGVTLEGVAAINVIGAALKTSHRARRYWPRGVPAVPVPVLCGCRGCPVDAVGQVLRRIEVGR